MIKTSRNEILLTSRVVHLLFPNQIEFWKLRFELELDKLFFWGSLPAFWLILHRRHPNREPLGEVELNPRTANRFTIFISTNIKFSFSFACVFTRLQKGGSQEAGRSTILFSLKPAMKTSSLLPCWEGVDARLFDERRCRTHECPGHSARGL